VSKFGDTLQRLGGLHGLNSRQTAQLLGLSEQAVSELIRGKREPSMDTAKRVKNVFMVDPLAMHEGIESILPSICDQERFVKVEKYIKQREEFRKRDRELRVVDK
jgi:transcriptional regulator with XRE-family HTH domain